MSAVIRLICGFIPVPALEDAEILIPAEPATPVVPPAPTTPTAPKKPTRIETGAERRKSKWGSVIAE